jgi:CBS domain-containing protein
MHIAEILRRKGNAVVTVSPDESVRGLVGLLKKHNLGAVVVIASDSEIAGIVSERDVIRRLADGAEVLDRSVETIMTPVSELHSCTAETSVDELMALMTEQRVRHVPVLNDDGQLAGIVSIGDVVKSRIGELQFERDELEHYVTG